MLKQIVIVIILLTNSTISSQNNESHARVKVTYGIKTHLDKNIRKHKYLIGAFPDITPKMESVSSEFEFLLFFNNKSSLFFIEKKLYSDNEVADLVGTHVGYYGRIKQQSTNYITEELQEDFGRFLVSRPYQEWQLHDESKMIDNYLCFKATTFYTITNPVGEIFKYDFTAWYAPELPYKYGPAGYGNLPGLIIELQGGSFTYGVKKIEFFKENENSKFNKMPKLKRLKQIDEEEFERLAAEDEKRWRERHK